jgi:integrase
MVEQAIQLEPLEQIKVALLLQYLTGARVGDIMQLTTEDITLLRNLLDVCFAKGKGVLLRGGKYTVHTVVPEQWVVFLTTYLSKLKKGELVVPERPALKLAARTTALNKALKRVDSRMTSRSIRRGALQAMALGAHNQAPVDMQTLMSYAGHKREETTRRYLDWSRLFGEGAQRERQAAAALTGAKASGEPRPPPAAPARA